MSEVGVRIYFHLLNMYVTALTMCVCVYVCVHMYMYMYMCVYGARGSAVG
jgi:hypothetical protein